jgi:hypothetical protein
VCSSKPTIYSLILLTDVVGGLTADWPNEANLLLFLPILPFRNGLWTSSLICTAWALVFTGCPEAVAPYMVCMTIWMIWLYQPSSSVRHSKVKESFMLGTDLLWGHGKLRSVAEEFATDQSAFLKALRSGWEQLAGSDRLGVKC